MQAVTARTEWRDNYLVVITGFFGMGVAVFASMSIGLFIEPIEQELGWGRGQISSALILQSVVSFIGASFAGRLIDRYGVRKVGLPGMLVYCSGIALLGTMSSSVWLWWTLWTVISIGYIFINPTLWAAAVAQRFDVSRGVALACAMSGSGALLVFMPLAVSSMISDHGWRVTYMIVGLAAAAIMLPLMLVFLKDRRPQLINSEAVRAPDDQRKDAHGEVRSIVLSSRFIRLTVGCFVLTLATMGLQVHYVPMVTSMGLDRTTAAAMAGLIGIGSITGRLTCGFFLDRWRGQIIGALYFALPVVSTLMLISFSGNRLAGGIAAFIQGLALGAELDVLAFLIGRYYALRNYGVLMGTVMCGVIVAAGIGPTLAGLLFDATGSYVYFLVFAATAFLVAAILIGTLGDYDSRRSPSTLPVGVH